MCWKLAERQATDEFPGWIVRTHFCCKPDGMLAAVRVSEPQNIRHFFAYNSANAAVRPPVNIIIGKCQRQKISRCSMQTLPEIWYWLLLDKGNFIAERALLYLPMTAP